MNKDCNGCFGAAGDDCQRCQKEDNTEHSPKLDITPELAIAAYNTLIQFCRQQEATEDGTCCRCILYDHCPAKSDTIPEEWEEMPLPFLDGNTVTYIKDGQIQCSKCYYFSKANGGNISVGLCDYISLTGHSRRCSPLDCKKKGIFKEKERKRRK